MTHFGFSPYLPELVKPFLVGYKLQFCCVLLQPLSEITDRSFVNYDARDFLKGTPNEILTSTVFCSTPTPCLIQLILKKSIIFFYLMCPPHYVLAVDCELALLSSSTYLQFYFTKLFWRFYIRICCEMYPTFWTPLQLLSVFFCHKELFIKLLHFILQSSM